MLIRQLYTAIKSEQNKRHAKKRLVSIRLYRNWSRAPNTAATPMTGMLAPFIGAAPSLVVEAEEPEEEPELPSLVVGLAVSDLHWKEPRMTLSLWSFWKESQLKLPVDCMLKPPLTFSRAGRLALLVIVSDRSD